MEPSDIETPNPPETLPPVSPPEPDPDTPQPLRLGILAANVLLLVGVTAAVFLNPNVGNLREYEFPEDLNLRGWKLEGSEALEPVEKPEYEGSSYRAGRHYRFRQGDTPLDIEIRYVTETLGGVDLFTREHERFTAEVHEEAINARIRSSAVTGHFAEISHGGYAYITACINPRGFSSATPEQYERNQELYDMVIERAIPWLLGRERWRDDRCLWTLMYTPLGDDPQVAHSLLETAWQDWFQLWQGNFPPL
ncbi:MAG: cyanoexosortase A system-associated protein [Spirulina sp. DLM2.Bin59]|nr:MAG: cyanoexosortase A system-associated protein [Spirulina sp. DLM2.Bin59]